MPMKRFYTTLCTAAIATMAATAQNETTMHIGYCADESADAIGLYEKDLNVAAVKFEGDFLSQYAGCEVKSLSIQLGASFGSAGSVFITDALSAPVPERFDYEQDIPDFDWVPCYQWIDIPLDKPFTLDPDAPFYAGIRILPYTAAPYCGAWQFAVDDNAEAARHSYIYDAQKKTWDLTTKRSWEDGLAPSFLIRLIVSGDALPTNDIAVTAVSSKDYMRTRETSSCTYTVTNLAANDVKSFDAELLLDGAVAVTKHVELETPLVTNAEKTFTLDGVTFDTEGTHTVGVRTTLPNGEADTHPDNNTAERQMSVIDRYYDRNVLVEAFTTMSCANCPGAHEREDAAFEGVSNVVRVDHHSGFGTDILTTQLDTDHLWFYNNGGTTYAPGIMMDRAMVDDFFDVQRSPGEEHTPIFGPGEPENILFVHNTLAARPAYVDVNIAPVYDASTRQLSVTVSGEAIALLPGSNPVLNVWLTESGLSAADNPRYGQMTGSGKLDMTFVHNHAMRATLTGSWGEALEQGPSTYSRTFTTTLDAAWKPENMEIVAFVSNYDAQHPDRCFVHNSAACSFGNTPDGIDSPLQGGADGAAHTISRVSDLSGRPALRSSVPGVSIVTLSDGTVRKVVNL